MTNLSIRLRLTAWYSVVLLLGLVLFGFGVWFALYARLVAGLDTRLAQRVQGLRSAVAEGEAPDRDHMQRELSEFASDTPDGTLIELRDTSGRILVPSTSQRPLPRYLGSDRAARRTLRAGRPSGSCWTTWSLAGRLTSSGWPARCRRWTTSCAISVTCSSL